MNIVLKKEILDKLSAKGILVYVAMSMSAHGTRSTAEELAAIVKVKPESMQSCMEDAKILQNLELKKPRKPTEKKAEEPFELPAWIPVEAWQGFLDGRSKRPPTPYASRMIIKELERFRAEGMDAVAILNQSAMNGWAGVFPLKSVAAPFQPPPPTRLKQTEFRR